MKYSLLFLLLPILCCNCNSEKRKITQIVKSWENKEFLFPASLEIKVAGQPVEPIHTEAEYKILRYIDTSGCIPCQLKLYEWELLKREADSLHLNVEFVFIVYSENYEELEAEQRINHSTIPVMYDPQDTVNKLNVLPESPVFRTFLLDSTNHVVLTGDPLERKKLWELYKAKIKN